MKPLRVGVHWISPSTYLKACIDTLVLAQDPPVEVAVTFIANSEQNTSHLDASVQPAATSVDVLSGPRDGRPLRRFENDPCDIHLFSGRRIPAYRDLAKRVHGRARRVYVTDHEMSLSLKLLARLVWFRSLGRSHFDYAFVCGERQAVHARALGFRASDVWLGAYAAAAPLDVAEVQKQDKFSFAGRLVDDKGIRQLADGYARYRERAGSDAWPLVVVGIGPLAPILERVEGVIIRGFLEPSELWAELASARAFLLPSTFEPWGVVLHEAALAHLPIIASAQCGAVGHLVRDGWNGWILRSVEADSIADALQAAQSAGGRLEVMGARSAKLAEQFSPEQWAATVVRMAQA